MVCIILSDITLLCKRVISLVNFVFYNKENTYEKAKIKTKTDFHNQNNQAGFNMTRQIILDEVLFSLAIWIF